MKLCNKAGLLSHESVVIDGSKFRAVNADNKSYVSSNAKKVLLDVEEKISQYMKELDEMDDSESRPGALTKEDIIGVLDYLERRKTQLTEALEQLENIGENQICTTDPESRLMKTRDGIRPSFNVQTAVESKNHLIVHYIERNSTGLLPDRCCIFLFVSSCVEGRFAFTMTLDGTIFNQLFE